MNSPELLRTLNFAAGAAIFILLVMSITHLYFRFGTSEGSELQFVKNGAIMYPVGMVIVVIIYLFARRLLAREMSPMMHSSQANEDKKGGSLLGHKYNFASEILRRGVGSKSGAEIDKEEEKMALFLRRRQNEFKRKIEHYNTEIEFLDGLLTNDSKGLFERLQDLHTKYPLDNELIVQRVTGRKRE